MGLTPEEIRHVSLKRKLRGYDRRQTQRLLAEIAESYESVWHQRSELYEEVKRLEAEVQDADGRDRLQNEEAKDLHERLTSREAALANLREKAERLEADRGPLLAEVEQARTELGDLQMQIERLEGERSAGLREEQRSQAELVTLREEIERIQADRDGLLEESRRSEAEVVWLRKEVERLEAERNLLHEESQRSRAELDEVHKELRHAGQASTAQLAELRQQVQRLEAEQEALRDRVEEKGAQLGMHPRVARQPPEDDSDTRARQGEGSANPPKWPANEERARPQTPPRDDEQEREAAHLDPRLLWDLSPETRSPPAEEPARERFTRRPFEQ